MTKKRHVGRVGMPSGMEGKDPLFEGLSPLQCSRAYSYEALGFGSLGLITDVLRSTREEDRRQAEDWENSLLIQHQNILWAYGYNLEERVELYRHIGKLRITGRYPEVFALYARQTGDA